MSESSWMMGGGKMTIELDAPKGQAVGSMIRLRGRVLGLTLGVDEAVTERVAPVRKVWQTVGEPRLLVMGPYTMGFEISGDGGGSRLRVFIDYVLPRSRPAHLLGLLFGGFCARWCTRQMVLDAAGFFAAARSNPR
jgi:hypothetical protein